MVQCERRGLPGDLSQQVVIPTPPSPELRGFPLGRALPVTCHLPFSRHLTSLLPLDSQDQGDKKGDCDAWLLSQLLGFVSLPSAILPHPCSVRTLFGATGSGAETFAMRPPFHGS